MNEVADIFREYGQSYRESHKLSPQVLKTMKAIEMCRTAELGGHVEQCESCGHTHITYNSCRNRHCPKCQNLAREQWLNAQKRNLLPVGYFHVVFTIPDDLNTLALQNPKKIYEILFKASSETMMELSRDPKYLGAEIGFTSILHTWGQNLLEHPHMHCIVPGGGLNQNGQWIATRDDFFIPVKVLSRLFRGKFIAYLKKARQDKELKYLGKINDLKGSEFYQLINELYQKEWVVYCKAPFQSAQHVLEYLGRYTHRVAISNNRIVKIEGGKVTFEWRDYRDDNRKKLMTLEAHEFIRRFLLHILPSGFMKIRHYGLLSNRSQKTKLKRCKELLGQASEFETFEKIDWKERLFRLTGIDLTKCPQCGGKMVIMVIKEVNKANYPRGLLNKTAA